MFVINQFSDDVVHGEMNSLALGVSLQMVG